MDWRKLIGVKAPKIPDMESTLAELRRQMAEAEADVAQLAAGRRAVLRDGSDDDVARHDERAAAAARRRDRAEVAIEEVTAKLDATRAEAAEAARCDRYDAAAARAEMARHELRSVYPEAVSMLRHLLRQVAEAEVAIVAANADRPAGADPIPGVELFRLGRGASEQVLSECEVELWVGRDGRPYPAELQPHFIASAGGAGYVPRGVPGGPIHEAWRLRLTETTFVPAEQLLYVDRLANTLFLPGLLPGDRNGWAPLKNAESVRPDGFHLWVLEELNRLDTAQPRPARKPKVRHQPVNLSDLYDAIRDKRVSATGNVHPETAENR